ncbi:MAG: hypothetical protein ACTSUD_12670 [Alphaproteobacteria bacterium]
MPEHDTILETHNKHLETMTRRILGVRAEIGKAWPTGADPATGAWATSDKLGWTAGYWIEMLRIAGERTDDWDLYQDAAARMTRLGAMLDRHNFYNAPAFYYGAARLYETLSDRASRTAALSAAYAVRAMANPARGALFVGRNSAQIKVPVEAAHLGLLLDWWALQETGDTTFLDGAERMLDLLIEDFIDGRESIPDTVSYEPHSGALIGAGKGSAAARAHALCGLLRGWEITREPRFLDAANRVLDHPAGEFSEILPAAMLCEALARLAVLGPPPKEARPFIDHLEATIDSLAQRLLPAFTGDAKAQAQAPIGALYHFYAALHCLDAGGLPC